MKRYAFTKILGAGAAVVLLAATAGAQEFRESVSTTTTQQGPVGQTGTFDLKLDRTDGVIVRVIRSGAPLQMINPRARAEYGDGKVLVEQDPIAGPPVGAVGIKLYSIRF